MGNGCLPFKSHPMPVALRLSLESFALRFVLDDPRARRIPVRVRPTPEAPCCHCGAATTSGIWVCENPKALSCQGAGAAYDEREP
jgi:hypothetical protein